MTSDRPIQLILAPKVAEEIRRETLAWRGRETGGLWLGCVDSAGNYHVSDSVPAGPGAAHHGASFSPDEEFQNRELARRREVSPEADIVAMWHSHPGSFSTPSSTDAIAARSVLDDWGLSRPELIVGIAVVPDGAFSLRTFHMTAQTRTFHEVPWLVGTEAVSAETATWTALPGAQPYITALVIAARGRGFQLTGGDASSLRFIHADGQYSATVDFHPHFPFIPARLRTGSRSQRLPVDAALAGRLIRRMLGRPRLSKR